MLDLLIRNARICDGTGAPSIMGALGVKEVVTAKVPRYVNDLPCNGRRLISESEGIKATFVAGTQLYDEGKHTGAMPGRILRSYD